MNSIAQQEPDTGGMPYEERQRFNRVVAWLHSFRYRQIVALFDRMAREAQGQQIKVVEIGCAHGTLFATLNERFHIAYTGIENDASLAEVAKRRYGHQPNFRMIQDSVQNALDYLQNADVLVALETLEHIPEHEVVWITEAVAAAQPKLFVCSVPVEIGPAIWLKNVGSFVTGYMRHKEYRWSETWWAGLYQLDKLPPHGTGHKGFDWRWLAQTIRHNMKITKISKLPFGFLPAALAFSVVDSTSQRIEI
jgi:SAM-dependent methyltransferase